MGPMIDTKKTDTPKTARPRFALALLGAILVVSLFSPHAQAQQEAQPLPAIGPLLNEATTTGRLHEGDFLAGMHERCAGLKLTLLTLHQVQAESRGQDPDPELMALQPIMMEMVRRALVLHIGNGRSQPIAREITDQRVRKFARYYGRERVEIDKMPVKIAEDQKSLQADLNNCIALHDNLADAFPR